MKPSENVYEVETLQSITGIVGSPLSFQRQQNLLYFYRNAKIPLKAKIPTSLIKVREARADKLQFGQLSTKYVK